MGKIVMPKNSALLNEIEAVLKIYYEAGDWLSNDEYKEKLKDMIGDNQYESSYTKKAQITSYFGFTESRDIHTKRITDSGREMYEAIVAGDQSKIQEILMNSLERVTFGRNNDGCPESDSDVEPPSSFIRASMDLGYLTYKEFAYLLWKLEDTGGNYTDSLSDIRAFRISGQIELGKEAKKYGDAKPIMILVRWGFLEEDDSVAGARHIKVKDEVLDKYQTRLKNLKIYNIDMDYFPDSTNDRIEHEVCEGTDQPVIINEAGRIKKGSNIILYGVPGSGKSWTIDHEYCHAGSKVERLVFHPDYLNADFIGQILPVVDQDKQVTYQFQAGPFTKIMRKAYLNPAEEYILIIEEINRGNAPAIFGEVFQLLDRTTVFQDGIKCYQAGTSAYGITHSDMAGYIYGDPGHEVRIPSNLSIIATMNTSDQNVFTLDTAFQRRWEMRLVENNFDHVRLSLAGAEILDTGITWKKFCTVVNRIITENKAKMMSGEDKRLGVYFVNERELKNDHRADPEDPTVGIKQEYDSLIEKERKMTLSETERARLTDICEGLKQNRIFPEKVIKYLWDDAFKFTPEVLFDVGEGRMSSLEEIIRIFVYSQGKDRFNIFKDAVRQELYE